MRQLLVILVGLLVSVMGCDVLPLCNTPAPVEEETLVDGLDSPSRSPLLVRIEGSSLAYPSDIIELTAVATGGASGYTFAWTMSDISVGWPPRSSSSTPRVMRRSLSWICTSRVCWRRSTSAVCAGRPSSFSSRTTARHSTSVAKPLMASSFII